MKRTDEARIQRAAEIYYCRARRCWQCGSRHRCMHRDPVIMRLTPADLIEMARREAER